ncbi:MAG TPA: ribosome maturation factor RimM [Candidatus Binataceae bacterium]|nr:ribosome maturation factor RimM [Candidatus Binataceae bacterium]
MTAPDQFKSRGLIAFGRIVGVHGLRGALRVRPDNPESNPQLLERLFVDREGTPVEHRVRSSARAGRGSLKLELEGIETIEQAQALRGVDLYLAIDDLPPAADKEFYYYQVVGLRVETTEGRPLGTIDEIFFNGANDVWVVKGGSGEVLIPVIEDVVRKIDLEGGRVIIEAIPGLLG